MQIWYDSVPHPKLVYYKKDQHWVVKSNDDFIFPGGSTQFKEGVQNYINFIEKVLLYISMSCYVKNDKKIDCIIKVSTTAVHTYILE